MSATWTEAQAKEKSEIRDVIQKNSEGIDKIISILEEIRADIKDMKYTPTTRKELSE